MLNIFITYRYFYSKREIKMTKKRKNHNVMLRECPIRGEGVSEINRCLIYGLALRPKDILDSYSPYIQKQVGRLKYYKNTIDEFDKVDQKIPLGELAGLFEDVKYILGRTTRISNPKKYFSNLRKMLKEDRRKSLLKVKGLDRRICNGDKKSASLSDKKVRYLGQGDYKCHILRIPWFSQDMVSRMHRRLRESAIDDIDWKDYRSVSPVRYFNYSGIFMEDNFFSVSELFINTVIDVLDTYGYDTSEISDNIVEPISKKINISAYIEDKSMVLIVPIYPGKAGVDLIKSSGFRGRKIGNEYYWYKNLPLNNTDKTLELMEYLEGRGFDVSPYHHLLYEMSL